LFCGGGGISEGLKQAGLSIVFGLDTSKPAVDTFSHNHPDAEVIKASIVDIDVKNIPEFDVLVGGPPCVEFSASKQGRGNILAGLKLVQAFLRVQSASPLNGLVLMNRVSCTCPSGHISIQQNMAYHRHENVS